MSLKIGIITTTVREISVGNDVAKWTYDYAVSRNDGNVYELVRLDEFNLPVFGSSFATEEQLKEVARWQAKIAEFDAFVFVTAEYNHGATGPIKNATDFLKEQLFNKVAGFVGYGSLGGARAIENLRVVLAELQVATVQKTVNFLLSVDFENFTKFKPIEFHSVNAKVLFEQLNNWGKALKPLR